MVGGDHVFMDGALLRKVWTSRGCCTRTEVWDMLSFFIYGMGKEGMCLPHIELCFPSASYESWVVLAFLM